MLTTVGHQIFDSHQRHIVFLRKLDAFRRARHGAIVVGQFTQNASRFKTCQAYQIDSGFSMATAGQELAWPYALSVANSAARIARTTEA